MRIQNGFLDLVETFHSEKDGIIGTFKIEGNGWGVKTSIPLSKVGKALKNYDVFDMKKVPVICVFDATILRDVRNFITEESLYGKDSTREH